jgi:hypothetical protein
MCNVLFPSGKRYGSSNGSGISRARLLARRLHGLVRYYVKNEPLLVRSGESQSTVSEALCRRRILTTARTGQGSTNAHAVYMAVALGWDDWTGGVPGGLGHASGQVPQGPQVVGRPWSAVCPRRRAWTRRAGGYDAGRRPWAPPARQRNPGPSPAPAPHAAPSSAPGCGAPRDGERVKAGGQHRHEPAPAMVVPLQLVPNCPGVMVTQSGLTKAAS